MRYVTARYEMYQRELAYRFYVTDCLRILTENTANTAQGGGQYIKKRYCDIIFPQAEQDIDPQKIADDIIKRAGLEVING